MEFPRNSQESNSIHHNPPNSIWSQLNSRVVILEPRLRH